MSIIGSLRSSKLMAKHKQQTLVLDRNLTVQERMNDFILSRGDMYILPYLDKSDIEKIKLGKPFSANRLLVNSDWNNLVSSQSLFKSILTSISDVQT